MKKIAIGLLVVLLSFGFFEFYWSPKQIEKDYGQYATYLVGQWALADQSGQTFWSKWYRWRLGLVSKEKLNEPGRILPLPEALRFRNREIFYFLLERGADPTLATVDGHTTWEYAELAKDQEVMGKLEAMGLKPSPSPSPEPSPVSEASPTPEPVSQNGQ